MSDPNEPPGEPTRSHPDPEETQRFPPSDLADGSPGELPPGLPSLPPRYRPIRFHARGGLGEVFIAEDTELHRRVALKRVRPHHAANPEALRRFIREAETTARLQHPGVVPVYGLVWDSDGRPWYAMRFVEGEPFRDAIARIHGATSIHFEGGRVPVGGVVRAVMSHLLSPFMLVCQTVAFAHKHGIIHRDLKPDNIMLGRFGEVFVVDWGLARSFAKRSPEFASDDPSGDAEADALVTQPGAVRGTPAFMSPEQAAGRVELLGEASDIYSLGAILYVVLTGRVPFEAARLPDLLAGVMSGQFPHPRTLDPAIPRALECICLKAMALKPRDRYLRAEQLAADISRWMADEPVSVHREPLRKRLRRWEARHQWMMPRIMFYILGAFMLFWIVSLYQIDTQRMRQIEELRKELDRVKNSR